jgi:hypothetical protein
MLFLAHVLPLASKLILDPPGNDGIDSDVLEVERFPVRQFPSRSGFVLDRRTLA